MQNDAPDASSEDSNDVDAIAESTSEPQEVAASEETSSEVSEPDEPSNGQPSVDDLEVRLDAIEAAMQQLQSGDIPGAESAIEALEAKPA